MLYVFHVDTGTMMTFDMTLLAKSVSTLQNVIARACHILEDKQVLLISGGESLDPSALVCKYHAGTDTNPIFLFSKSTIEAAQPPSPSIHCGSDVDIQNQVEGSLLLPPAYSTVVSRAQLALQIHDADKDEVQACEKLVHDQHLQQQGWAAVVANLEDITSALRQRSDIFVEAYTEYLQLRDEYLTTLASIANSLDLLSKIPVLPCLLQTTSDVSERSLKSTSSSGSSISQKSLFDWISSQDPQNSLQDMVLQCLKATEQLDQRVLETLMSEVSETFKQVDNPSMKEVKGIEDRLYGLDQILNGARRIVQEQSDMAQGFVQNQNRVSTLRDKSILPDLCSSHKKQLVVMVNNHKKLQDTKKKCRMAKEELAVNLHTRLRWVMLVEKKICDVDSKLMIYHENLKRLKKRLDILKQIHDAPRVYAQLVVEVVRRRKFSSEFTTWANNLAEESSQVHADEIKRRDHFLKEVGHHFLHTLFQGFEEFHSKFATEAPPLFDQNLPQITAEDVYMLRDSVPELAEILQVPTDVNITLKDSICDRSMFRFVDLKQEDKLMIGSPKVASLATSEIEIIKSSEEQFLSADKSLSLEEQVANSEITTTMVLKSEASESPSEKPEFLMPKSLSEELTKEMKNTCTVSKKVTTGETFTGHSIHVDQKLDSAGKNTQVIEASGASTSSGEQVKSTESDLSGVDKSTDDKSSESAPTDSKRSRKHQSTLDISPDMETSQEFTTADFYIEDSMPSSIADSPPNKSVVEKQHELSKSFEAESKTDQMQTLKKEYEALVKENENFKLKLKSSESKFNRLLDVVSTVPKIKSELKSLTSIILEDRNQCSNEMSDVKKKLNETICQYESNLQMQKEVELEKLQEQHQLKVKDLMSKVDNSDSKNIELEREVINLQENLDKLRDEQRLQMEKFATTEAQQKSEYSKTKCALDQKVLDSENLIQTLLHEKEEQQKCIEEMEASFKNEKLELEQKLQTVEEKYKTELEELKKQNELEMEVEMDKLRAELQEEIDKLDMNVSEKETELKLAGEKIEAIEIEKMKIQENMTQKFQKEKDDISRILDEEFQLKLQRTLSEEKEKLTSEHEKCISQLKDSHENELKNKLEELKCQLVKEKEEETDNIANNLNKEFEKSFEELKKSLEFEKEKLLAEKCSALTVQHTSEIENLQQEMNAEKDKLLTQLKVYTEKSVSVCAAQTDKFEVIQREVQTERKELSPAEIQTDQWRGTDNLTQTESRTMVQQGAQTHHVEFTQGEVQTDVKEVEERAAQASDDVTAVITQQEHSNLMTTLNVRLTAEKEKALIELRQKHEKEIAEIINKLEKSKEDSLVSVKTSLQAEKQVTFNEALGKVTQEKDKIIEELKTKESELMQQLESDKDTIEKLNDEKSKLEDIKTRAISHLTDKEREFSITKRKLEDELAMCRQQLHQYQSQIQSMSQMQISATPSVMEISGVDHADSHSKITELEEELKVKREEIHHLQNKLSDMAMTASTRSIVQDKVSITSCNIGDLALFCLDERHDQYVAFTIGSTLHFLHSDCLDTLSLRTVPNESRKSWVLAEITDKEYCQAKKPQNRFKVPVGTKFYRVKAKPWNRETASGSKTETASSSKTDTASS